MSRVGKYPVEIPAGVTVALAGNVITAKGKLGELQLALTDLVETKVEGNKVSVEPKTKAAQARMMWGTTRANIANMVKGVSAGLFEDAGDHRYRLPRCGAGPQPGGQPGLLP